MATGKVLQELELHNVVSVPRALLTVEDLLRETTSEDAWDALFQRTRDAVGARRAPAAPMCRCRSYIISSIPPLLQWVGI